MKRKTKKGQLAVEHLVIVGLTLLVIIPATFLLFNFAKSTSDSVNSQQVRSIGNVITYYGRDVYLRGPDNLVSVSIVLPEGVKNMSILSGQELVILYRTVKGPSEAVFFTDYPLIGPTGLQNELIVNRAGPVNLIINSTNNGVMVRER